MVSGNGQTVSQHSGFVFALPALIFVAAAYWVAWRFPRINK